VIIINEYKTFGYFGKFVYFRAALPGQLPFLAPTLDNADQLFSLIRTPGFYLHHVEGQIKIQQGAVYKQTYIKRQLL